MTQSFSSEYRVNTGEVISFENDNYIIGNVYSLEFEEKTVIGFPESTIGLLPIAGGISRIGKAVPRPKALEILLNSANINLEELRNLGLINEIFHIEEMENTLQKYIDKILKSTPESVEVLMKNFDKVTTLDLEKSFLLEEELGKELF